MQIKLCDIACDEAENNPFQARKYALITNVHLAHCNNNKILCIYVDTSASDTHCAGAATQILQDDKHLYHNDKRREPSSILSGHFDLMQMR